MKILFWMSESVPPLSVIRKFIAVLVNHRVNKIRLLDSVQYSMHMSSPTREMLIFGISGMVFANYIQ